MFKFIKSLFKKKEPECPAQDICDDLQEQINRLEFKVESQSPDYIKIYTDVETLRQQVATLAQLPEDLELCPFIRGCVDQAIHKKLLAGEGLLSLNREQVEAICQYTCEKLLANTAKDSVNINLDKYLVAYTSMSAKQAINLAILDYVNKGTVNGAGTLITTTIDTLLASPEYNLCAKIEAGAQCLIGNLLYSRISSEDALVKVKSGINLFINFLEMLDERGLDANDDDGDTNEWKNKCAISILEKFLSHEEAMKSIKQQLEDIKSLNKTVQEYAEQEYVPLKEVNDEIPKESYTWVNHPDAQILAVGKYKGQRLCDTPESYQRWIKGHQHLLRNI